MKREQLAIVKSWNGTRDSAGMWPGQDPRYLVHYKPLEMLGQPSEKSALTPAQSQRKGTLRES